MSPQEALFTMPNTRGADALSADPFLAAVPGWLADALEDVNPARRGAYAKLVPCGRCRGPVLYAADMGLDLMADSTVDPTLLEASTELQSLLGGRYTVEAEVLGGGRGIMLYRRDRWLIGKPAGARKRFALPEHRCGAPIGVLLPWQVLYPHVYAQTHNQVGEHLEPPF